MKVSVLGPVTAEHAGVGLRLGGRKQRAVLALLAMNVNSPVALDRLVHELWRDEPPAQATLSLQSYISRLRRTFSEAHRGGGEDAPTILTRAPGWVLVMPSAQVDAVRFAELIREGNTLLEASDPVAATARLREALALWTGDTALADLDDMPFAMAEKSRLQDMRLTAMETLLWAELDLGETAEVLDAARRLVRDNPYRERAWCALMLALYRQGRQADALAVAAELREVLAEGLGLDPSPEVRNLEVQILNQDAALDVPRVPPVLQSDLRAVGSATAAPAPTTHGGVLVGRRATTDALARIVARTSAGEGRFVVVEGPAGIGKSVILRDLAERLQDSGGLVLRGGGVSAGATPALWPWVAVLRQLVTADPDLAASARAGGSGSALSLLDPSVGTDPPDSGTDPGADQLLARTRLYRAVVDLLAAAHRSRRLALLIDDTHWLDADTLALLALASHELVPQGVVVAVALRNDEAPQVAAAIGVVEERLRAVTVRLPLSGLGAEDVAELLRRTGDVSDLDELARALVARTGGNPFFLNELVRLLASERRLDVASVKTVLPHQVRDVLRRRIDRLPAGTRALLVCVALLNRPAEVPILSGVTGLSVEAVLDDVESAVASSLLVEDPISGRFDLPHDLVRQTLEESVSGIRRARIHARIAEVMQELDRGSALLPEMVVELARHLVLAEPVLGPDAAIPYLVTVADDARERSAFGLAERALRTALDLSGRVPDPSRRTALMQDLSTRLALQSNVISGSAGSPIFGEVQLGNGASIDVVTDTTAWWGAQVRHVVDGEPALAREDAKVALARKLPVVIESVVHSVMGLSSFELGDLEGADRHLALAEELGQRAEKDDAGKPAPWLPSMLVSAPAVRSAAAVLTGDTSAAETHLERARERAGTAVPELVLVSYFTAWNAAVLGEVEIARDAAAAARELGVRLGDTFYLPMARVMLGWARAMLGEESGAEEARSAYDACAAIGLRFQASVHLLLCAEAHARHGHLEEARALARKSHAMADLSGERTLGKRLETLARTLLADPSPEQLS